MADADATYRLVSHQRVSQGAHTGQACEYLQVAATAGTFIHLSYEIPRSRVIAELNSRVWVRSDRSGLQFMARLVLPRTADPRTGSPITALLRGDIYDRVGSWQQLSIPQIDQLLGRQVRVLRSQFGAELDPREAFVDMVVLNVYGGAGVTNVWIDDLEISGQVPPTSFATPSVPPGGVAGAFNLTALNPKDLNHSKGSALYSMARKNSGRPPATSTVPCSRTGSRLRCGSPPAP